jgi:hypothetical protein
MENTICLAFPGLKKNPVFILESQAKKTLMEYCKQKISSIAYTYEINPKIVGKVFNIKNKWIYYCNI